MPLLAANRRALASRCPEALRQLDAAAPAVSTIPAPVAEPASFLEEAARCGRLLLVLTGVPAPATAAALRACCPREIVFWCVEPEAGPVAARLACEDCSLWFSDPRVFLSIGVPTTPELRRLNRELAWVDRARALPLPSRYSGDEERWRPLLVATLARIQQRWQNVLTDLHLAPPRWENTCANLPHFLAAPSVEAIAGAFAGTTLVLVAAGPSLDGAIPFLRQVAPHALIVTGNTSFRALADSGIAPHLTVTVDPFPATDLGYDGQPTDRTHLISPVFAFPAVHRRFAGRLFGLWDQSPLLARLRRATGRGEPPALLGDATVSATIFNLAAHLGCTRVVFVGQDFAIAADGRTHASDTFYTDLGMNRQDSEKTHLLPGTTLPQVTVPARHLWYLRTIEGLVARSPQIRCLNTSTQGALISGAPFADYDTVAQEIVANPPRDFAAEIAALHHTGPTPTQQAAMRAELDHARAAMGEALQLSLTAALTAEIALAEASPAGRRRFDSAARNFEQWRSSRPSEQTLLFEGRTKPEIFEAEKRRVRIQDTVSDRPLREATELAWAFAEGAASIRRHLAAVTLPPSGPGAP